MCLSIGEVVRFFFNGHKDMESCQFDPVVLMEILWRGRISLENVHWSLSAEEEIRLELNLEKHRRNIWRETKTKHPESYDGKLLVLTDMRVKEHEMQLTTGYTRFSSVLTLEKFNLGFTKYGTLGVQAIILSNDLSHILIGQRAADLMYCPLYLSGPGGMLETSDVEGSFQAACLRELMEEASVAISPKMHLVAATMELNGTVGTVMIVVGKAAAETVLQEPVVGNEEWENRSLLWFEIDSLHSFEQARCLESIHFALNEWNQYQLGRENVIWR